MLLPQHIVNLARQPQFMPQPFLLQQLRLGSLQRGVGLGELGIFRFHFAHGPMV